MPENIATGLSKRIGDNIQRIAAADSVRHIGKVVAAHGTTIRISGLPVRIGQLCRLYETASDWELKAEVIGISDNGAVLQPFGHLRGITNRARVEPVGDGDRLPVGHALLGRIVNSAGTVIDGDEIPRLTDSVPVMRQPPAPLSRNPIDTVVTTGIRAIDSLLTCGRGQRIGIFAPAGAGKSTLLGMLATHSAADINVIALIGERGREVLEFVENNLAPSRTRTVVVVATSDEPSLLRARAAYTATAIAEYFRDQGLHVLLLADSLTRYSRALRDIGLATGESATRSGFPPSVFSALPQLLERAGTSDTGSITAFYTMLVEDDDALDPIAEETVSILDGHFVLSRKLAMAGHYPAIDVLTSVSRLMDHLVAETHNKNARRARELLSKYQSLELLIQMGEYQQGNDPEADAAVAAYPHLQRHLHQGLDTVRTFDESIASLASALVQKDD